MEKAKPKAKSNPEKCKGCYYCIRACPKDAISIMDTPNTKGYNPVVVDPDKCIACGMCYQVCPDTAFEIE